jgi:hypothetical protein
MKMLDPAAPDRQRKWSQTGLCGQAGIRLEAPDPRRHTGTDAERLDAAPESYLWVHSRFEEGRPLQRRARGPTCPANMRQQRARCPIVKKKTTWLSCHESQLQADVAQHVMCRTVENSTGVDSAALRENLAVARLAWFASDSLAPGYRCVSQQDYG